MGLRLLTRYIYWNMSFHMLYRLVVLTILYRLEKYESQWERLSHILWKITAMFETTNQCISINSHCSIWDSIVPPSQTAGWTYWIALTAIDDWVMMPEMGVCSDCNWANE